VTDSDDEKAAEKDFVLLNSRRGRPRIPEDPHRRDSDSPWKTLRKTL